MLDWGKQRAGIRCATSAHVLNTLPAKRRDRRRRRSPSNTRTRCLRPCRTIGRPTPNSPWKPTSDPRRCKCRKGRCVPRMTWHRRSRRRGGETNARNGGRGGYPYYVFPEPAHDRHLPYDRMVNRKARVRGAMVSRLSAVWTVNEIGGESEHGRDGKDLVFAARKLRALTGTIAGQTPTTDAALKDRLAKSVRGKGLVVARDRIELSTLRFSVVCSTN